MKKFDFDKVKQHVSTLPNIDEKIIYLLQQKTEFNQDFPFRFGFVSDLPDRTFEMQCDEEIKMWKEIASLKTNDKKQSEVNNDEWKDFIKPDILNTFQQNEKKVFATKKTKTRRAAFALWLLEKKYFTDKVKKDGEGIPATSLNLFSHLRWSEEIKNQLHSKIGDTKTELENIKRLLQ